MAKMQVGSGLDQYIAELNKLAINTSEVLGRSIYVGTDIVADEVRKNIEKITVSNSPKRGTQSDPIDTITSAQKTGLLQGFGISGLATTDGITNVKLGFDGYNSQVATTSVKAKWTDKRQANIMIARAVEGGTSFRRKHPFVAPAVRATKKKAEAAMAEQLDKEIEKAMK